MYLNNGISCFKIFMYCTGTVVIVRTLENILRHVNDNASFDYPSEWDLMNAATDGSQCWWLQCDWTATLHLATTVGKSRNTMKFLRRLAIVCLIGSLLLIVYLSVRQRDVSDDVMREIRQQSMDLNIHIDRQSSDFAALLHALGNILYLSISQ